jgi:hypothetical protein
LGRVKKKNLKKPEIDKIFFKWTFNASGQCRVAQEEEFCKTSVMPSKTHFPDGGWTRLANIGHWRKACSRLLRLFLISPLAPPLFGRWRDAAAFDAIKPRAFDLAFDIVDMGTSRSVVIAVRDASGQMDTDHAAVGLLPFFKTFLQIDQLAQGRPTGTTAAGHG